jgi:hypothetical protein
MKSSLKLNLSMSSSTGLPDSKQSDGSVRTNAIVQPKDTGNVPTAGRSASTAATSPVSAACDRNWWVDPIFLDMINAFSSVEY